MIKINILYILILLTFDSTLQCYTDSTQILFSEITQNNFI